MARRRGGGKRPWGSEHVPLDMDRLGSIPRREAGPRGEEYTVRQVRGSDKTYRCPGCDQEIAAGVAHVVVWPAEHIWGAEAGTADRRHWHTSCWRSGRRPTRRR